MRWTVVGAAGFLDEQFPIVAAQALDVASGGVVQKFLARGFSLRAFPKTADIQTINFLSLGQRLAGEGGDGGENVDGPGEFIANCTRRNSRAAHHTGHALAALKSGPLAFAQQPG